MPAGVSMPRYIAFFTASMLSMLAGSQVVHRFYRPLEDLDDMIKKELEEYRKQISESNLPKKI